ncbi:hypothetical protein T01_14900 [Trichinella spiralis]|uniref:Uncharacterized protein n=1 Tax=Trichinella spiralis TaxID=6334 RepID=A0A0V1BWI4_TRISP|nr:hypothetical protein T01_14900 [Trichinella spiralis]
MEIHLSYFMHVKNFGILPNWKWSSRYRTSSASQSDANMVTKLISLEEDKKKKFKFTNTVSTSILPQNLRSDGIRKAYVIKNYYQLKVFSIRQKARKQFNIYAHLHINPIYWYVKTYETKDFDKVDVVYELLNIIKFKQSYRNLKLNYYHYKNSTKRKLNILVYQLFTTEKHYSFLLAVILLKLKSDVRVMFTSVFILSMDLITELKLNRIKFALLRNEKKIIALNVSALFSRAIVIGQCTGNANNLLENVPWACQNICPKLSDHAFTHGGKLFSRVASFAFTAAISSGDEIPPDQRRISTSLVISCSLLHQASVRSDGAKASL